MIQIDTNPNPKLKSGHDNCFEEFKPFLMGYPRQFFCNDEVHDNAVDVLGLKVVEGSHVLLEFNDFLEALLEFR